MKFHSTQTDSPGNWKGELDEIQLAPAGANGGLSMFPESTNSGAGKYLQVEHPPSTATNQLQIGVTFTMWIPDDVARFRCVIVHQHGAGITAAEKGLTAAWGPDGRI